MSKYNLQEPAARPKRSPPKADIDDLTFLSWRDIEQMGGPSKWTLQRAARRGEIKLSKLGRSGGARATEYRRYVEKRGRSR
jgi:hypothetical protein